MTIDNKINPQHKGTKTLFKHPVLEKLSRTHVMVPIILFFSISVFLILYGFFSTPLKAEIIAGLFLTGFVIFTLVEYIVHRFVFHMQTDTKQKEKIQYTVHGVHHEYPKDKDRLAMPPLMSGTICAILFILCRVIMGNYTYAFLPGFLSGYATYLLVHFAVHAFQPPRNFLKILWVNHAIHHYKNQDKAYGVSSPLWDFIFGTLPPKKG